MRFRRIPALRGLSIFRPVSAAVRIRIWDVGFDAGALEMLLSGRWDATSQLVSRDAELKQTMAACLISTGSEPAGGEHLAAVSQ